MTADPNQMSVSATTGLLLYTGLFVVASMEAVPGWGLFNLGLPTWMWIAAMGAVGLSSGAMILENHRRIGALGGVIAGVCAMLFVVGMMQKADQVRAATLVMAGTIGSLPGIGVAALLNRIAEHRSPDRSGAKTAHLEATKQAENGTNG